MTKVTTSKQLMEEYNSISSKAESFGKWLMKMKIKYKFHREGEKYGEGTADKLKLQARITTKVDENLIAMYYKEAVNNILAGKKWKHLKWWS